MAKALLDHAQASTPPPDTARAVSQKTEVTSHAVVDCHGSNNVMRNLTKVCPITYYTACRDRFIFQQGSEAILGAR